MSRGEEEGEEIDSPKLLQEMLKKTQEIQKKNTEKTIAKKQEVKRVEHLNSIIKPFQFNQDNFVKMDPILMLKSITNSKISPLYI